MTYKRPHGNLIPEINLNSRIFNPKADAKGKRLNENRLLADMKYQYIDRF